MITLKIREKGHLVEIPGIAPFRTPADIDISKIEIRKVIGHLQVCGITDYEITAVSPKGDTEIYNQEDFSPKKKKKKVIDPFKKEIESRFDRLENMLMSLFTREKKGNDEKNKEQITEKLDRLERLSEKLLKSKSNVVYRDFKEKIIDEEDDEQLAFIPDIDISDLKLKSSSVKSVKQDQMDELNDVANSLSELLGGKK